MCFVLSRTDQCGSGQRAENNWCHQSAQSTRWYIYTLYRFPAAFRDRTSSHYCRSKNFLYYPLIIVNYYKYQRNFQQKLLTGRNLWCIRLKLLCYYIHKIVMLICTFLYFYFFILSFISFIFPSFVYSNFVMFKASFHGFFSSFKFERFVYHMFLGFYFLLHWDASTAHFYLSLWQAQCGITQLIMVVMLSGIYWLLREGSLGYQRSLI